MRGWPQGGRYRGCHFTLVQVAAFSGGRYWDRTSGPCRVKLSTPDPVGCAQRGADELTLIVEEKRPVARGDPCANLLFREAGHLQSRKRVSQCPIQQAATQ